MMSFQNKFLLPMCLLFSFPAGAEILNQERVSRIYAVGDTQGRPLFVQKTHYKTFANGETTSDTTIVDAAGVTVVTEVAIYRGDELISQRLDQLQTGDRYTVDVRDGKVFFTDAPIADLSGKPPGGDVKKSDVDLTADFLPGPLSEIFLAKHWDELMRGDTVHSRFSVPEITDTVGFKFFVKEKTKINGKDVVLIAMKPSSVFISMALSEIDLYVDPQTKHYVKYLGRTPLKLKDKNGKLKSLDGEILYEAILPAKS